MEVSRRVIPRPPGVVPDVYFSFASYVTGFLGAVVMPGPAESAFARLNAAGLNPGGEVLAWEVPPGAYPLERLIGKEEMVALGGTRRGDLVSDELDEVDRHTRTVACEECNPPR